MPQLAGSDHGVTEVGPPEPRRVRPRELTGRPRVLNALGGVVPASVAIPLVLGVWSPAWFAWLWFASYVSISAVMSLLVYRRSSPALEQVWSTSVSLLFAALPITAAVWSDLAQDWWRPLPS